MLYLLLQLLGGFLYRIDLVIAVISSQTSLLTLTVVIFLHWQSSEENKNSFIRFCLFSWGRFVCAITNIWINWWATGFDTWAISSRSTDKYLMFHEIFKLFLSEDNRVSHGLNYTGQPILAFIYDTPFSYIYNFRCRVHSPHSSLPDRTEHNYDARKYQ